MHDISTATGYLIGLDLGDRRDYTAVTALRQHLVPTGGVTKQAVGFSLGAGTEYAYTGEAEYQYDVIYADRWRGQGYKVAPPIVQELIEDLRKETHRQRSEAGILNWGDLPVSVLVDATGVGIAVLEDIRASGLECTGITITAGNSYRQDGRDYYVSKSRLISSLRVLVESRRLHLAEELALTPTMRAEFENFRKSTKLATGTETYNAGEGAEWREGEHDDLVLSAAMAAWFGETDDPAGRVAFSEMLRRHYAAQWG